MNLGKNILTDFQPFVDAILADAMENQDWPDNAEFKISYRTKAWPLGYGETRHVYFTSRELMDAWEANYAKWAGQDGNSVEYTVYQWDLGPRVLKHEWF